MTDVSRGPGWWLARDGKWYPPESAPLPPPPSRLANVPISRFGSPTAEWWKRLLAIILDSIVVAAIGAVAFAVFKGILAYAVDPLVGFVYYGSLNGAGQTLGKKLLHIRVVDQTTGQPIGFGRGLLRYLVYLLLFLACLVPGVINVLSPLWDNQRQAWHDKAVSSLVVNE